MKNVMVNSYSQFHELWKRVHHEMDKRIIGQDKVIDQILMAILCRGHCLLVGVPGLAKTYIIKTLSDIMALEFKRIQFTPDLMPSDITGSEVLQMDEEGRRSFQFVKGPVFTQMLLADEINRTPPKTQAALLEAMQERKVTVMGKDYPLSEPFFVLATQNPVEQEGTYKLPEAELDRFMFCLHMGYSSFDEEVEVTVRTTMGIEESVKKVLSAEAIMDMQELVMNVPIPESVSAHIVKIVRSTRPGQDGVPDFVDRYVQWGAGPRACQSLALAGKVNALLAKRVNVSREDVEKAAFSVLNHRVLLNFNAEADGKSIEWLIDKVLGSIK